MHKILVDTCVWLDMAKDKDQQALLGVIEELVTQNKLMLIVPRTVLEEFRRNKERIIKEGGQSLSSLFKKVKGVVDQFGDPKSKKLVLAHLDNVDFKIPTLGETVLSSITRIEKLLSQSAINELTNEIKLNSAQRAIDKKAPFHRQRNSINDAIIIETYISCIKDKNSAGDRFAFITHNKSDFSKTNGNERLPHDDLAIYFSKVKSRYFIKLAEAIKRIEPELVTEMMIDEEWTFEPRTLTEILKVENELIDKIWYDRHQMRAHSIATGKIKLIDRKDYDSKTSHNTIVKDIWNGAIKAAKRVEKHYGKENLGPYDDFEWGMLSGKMSAIRWVTGDEWDNLDT